MNNLFNVYLLFHLYVTADSYVYRNKNLRLDEDGTYLRKFVNLSIGTPAINLPVQFSHVLNQIVLIDSECGQHVSKCPNYCKERTFMEFYCQTKCQKITVNEIPMHCGHSESKDRYNVNNSSTYKTPKGNIDWNARLEYTRYLRGEWALDNLNLQLKDGTQIIKIDSAAFVRGLFLDSRLFAYDTNNPALFGLAPDPQRKSLVWKAVEKKLAKNAIVSFSNNSMSVGGLNDQDCKNWNSFAPINNETWVVRADKIELAGQVTDKAYTTIFWDLQEFAIYVPFPVLAQLIKADILKNDGNFNFFLKNCDGPFELALTLNKTVYTLTKDQLLFNHDHENCYTRLRVTDPVRFRDTSQWYLGYKMFENRCHAYDYENNLMFFGELK